MWKKDENFKSYMIPVTDFAPESQKNFFESGGFTMGRAGYLKQKFFF